jgi:hypothetical protein
VIEERHQLPVDASVTGAEMWLILYSLGLTLDKIASVLEHGWSGIDLLITMYFTDEFAPSFHSEHVEWHRYVLLCFLLCVFLSSGFRTRGEWSCDPSLRRSVAVSKASPM